MAERGMAGIVITCERDCRKPAAASAEGETQRPLQAVGM